MRRRWAAAGLLVAACAGLVLGRALTEDLPKPAVTFVFPKLASLPGDARIAWPPSGEAALETASGGLLGESGSQEPVPIASIAKVMTAYIVLLDHPLVPGAGGPELTVTPAEAAQAANEERAGDSVVLLKAGQSLDEYEALEALLIASADNVASMLAIFDAGSVPAFVAKMNAEASALGMDSTHYADPSGLDPATVSTPVDLLRLARAAIANKVFASIVAEHDAYVPGLGELANYNTLAGTGGFTGIKTGSTGAAGGCLLFSVSRPAGGSDYPLIGVVLDQRGGPYVEAALRAARRLVSSAYSALRPRTLLPAGAPVALVMRADQRRLTRLPAPLRLLGIPGQKVRLSAHRAGSLRYLLLAQSSASSASVTVPAALPPPPTLWWRLSHLFA